MRIVILSALPLLLLAACGFQPMYGQSNKASPALYVGIKVEAPNDPPGQQLKHNLEDRLNPDGQMPAHPAYKLHVTLASAIGGMGVARDGTVSRYNVTLVSEYVLTDLATGKAVNRGQIHHVSSFNNQVNQYFSTFVAQEDSIKRGIVELSEIYRQRIGAVLIKGPKPEEAKPEEANRA